MRSRFVFFFLFFALAIDSAWALVSSEAVNPSAPKAISDLRDEIVKGLGFQAEESLKVSGFDVRDALVGQSVVYEFDIEVGKQRIPIKLLEDLTRWDFVDLPIFSSEEEEEEKGLVEMRKRNTRKNARVSSPVLPPFQLAGPMELWIQDGDDMRLSLLHDVEAGLLKKVILSDGAVVTVRGARSVSLRQPLELPLPLNRSSHKANHPLASGLLSLADALRNTARSNEKPLLSFRIVSPTSLASSSSMSPKDKLKLKLLAPGLIELSSPSVPAVSDGRNQAQATTTLWPLTSLNGSNSNLRAFEELLASVLGKKGEEEGSFRLVKAEVSARTYVKMGFSVEKKLLDGDFDQSGFAEWKTKPEKATAHFEVLARVEENGNAIPERIAEVQKFEADQSMPISYRTGNVSMSRMPVFQPPPVYFTL